MHSYTSFSRALHVDSEARRSGVVGSIVSYSRSQTFLSGSNLASTPAEGGFLGRDEEEYGSGDEGGEDEDDAERDNDDEVNSDWDREQRAREEAHPDDGFVGTTSHWDDEPESPATTTLGPSTFTGPSPFATRPRTQSRPISGSFQPRYQSTRVRNTSTPTVPPSSIRTGRRGRGSSISPPLGASVDARPSSAPIIPRFGPSSPTRLDERTPLISISGASSTYTTPPVSTPSSEATLTNLVPLAVPKTLPERSGRKLSPADSRRHSVRRRRSNIRKPALPPGRSTYGQTLFNSVAILLGIGMLSCPLAFACAGWLGGTVLLIFYGFLTCYTARVLAKIILSDGRLRTYADIGQAAFGPRSNIFTSFLFCLELFAVSVILVVLFSDSLHEVVPQYSSNSYKVLGLLVIIPTSFFPLRVLSFASILGVLSTFMLIFVLIVDGTTKRHAPGSMWDGAPTEWWPAHAAKSVPITFGLFMAGFSGHAVIPSIVRDMQDPTHYESMINWAFFIATCVYGMIGAAGYQMFGRKVHDEVSQDLLRTPGYSVFFNKLALWMLVMSPLTKFSLSARPMNVTIEILLGIEESSPVPSHNKPRQPDAHNDPHAAQKAADAYYSDAAGVLSTTDDENPHSHYMSTHPAIVRKRKAIEKRKAVWRFVERTGLTIVVVLVAIYVPDFSTSMTFLGAFSAFALCVIGPLAAKMAIERRVTILDCLLIVIAVIMAVWATGIAIMEA
ncbi:hypothetical protein FRB99_003807 [Tulasnella sp. 403]|nr:hypothetical protein FRB99_003807 [Tulasnella sp. 403]